MQKEEGTVQKVVVIGASAGGVSALAKIISSLPKDLPAAILIVQHIKADRTTQLPEYFNRHSHLPVHLAEDGMLLKVGTVYIAEPGKHLIVNNMRLELIISEPVNYVRPSIDVLFASAAKEFGSNVVGVVLSGSNRDGTRGCQEIKQKGGITIAQDEETSQYFSMPGSAINEGAIDYVLPLSEIAGKIISLIKKNLYNPINS